MFRGPLFRACALGHTNLDRTLEMSRTDPGRFNTSEIGVIYASLDPDTALRELQRSGNGDVEEDCALLVVDAVIANVLDLTDASVRARWDLPETELTSDDMTACQRIVPAVVSLGFEAVRWSSAAGAGDSMAVYLDRFSADSRCVVMACHPLERETLDQCRAGRSIESILGPHALG
jgi:RES domain-containing protein